MIHVLELTQLNQLLKNVVFKTAKPFSRAFKEVTSIFPSTFIKNLNKIDNQSN